MKNTHHTWNQRTVAKLRNLDIEIGELAKGANPAYWRHLQDEAKALGYRGEYKVVEFLQQHGWFARRSFGSRGVDVFAEKSYQFPVGSYPGKNPWYARALLIDVKSTENPNKEPYFDQLNEGAMKEADRTNTPLIRAFCMKGLKPRFFNVEDGTEFPPEWFD